MSKFKNNIFLLMAFLTLIFQSCTQELMSTISTDENLTTQLRSYECPEPLLSLVTVGDYPCAHLKLVYNGVDDPESDCVLKEFEIKIFKIGSFYDIRSFDSPIVNIPNNPYLYNKSNWVGLVGGGFVNKSGPPLGVFNITTFTSIHDKFEFFMEGKPENGPKTWVCVQIKMDCNGTECTTTQCFDAWTPCA